MNVRCYVGTSGWVYAHWRGIFYPSDLPQPRWYNHYASFFDTVEINYSFYRLPSEKTFDRWQTQAPAGFVYALKANRFLTHVKRLKDVAAPLERFLVRARRLGDKLGPILWQLPPRWGADPARLESFATLLVVDRSTEQSATGSTQGSSPTLSHVFEFRDPAWFVQPVQEVLERFGLNFCIFDMPGLPCPPWITGDVVYLRFHGVGQVYAGRYGWEGLQPWAERIRQWLTEERTVYAYFNNDAFGHAVADAQTLRELLNSSEASHVAQPDMPAAG
jgi:uncharacterized protein YecE (DUF72 family)